MILAFVRTYGALYVLAVCVAAWFAAYAVAGVGPSTASQLVFSAGTATVLALWAAGDARLRRSTPCYEFDSIIFFTWPISVPAYLIATRGWLGLLIVFSALVFFVAGAMLMLLAGMLLMVLAGGTGLVQQ